MNHSNCKRNSAVFKPESQKGSALLISLIFLVILTVLGLAALSSSTNETQISTNIQQEKTAFYAAQSAANAYTNEGNAGNDLAEPAHILTLTRDAGTAAVPGPLTRCTAADGTNNVDCNATFIQENFKAKTETWYRGCNGPATECPGFSLGVGTAIPGCHRYEVRGEGWIDISGGGATPSAGGEEASVTVDQWLTEVALCPP